MFALVPSSAIAQATLTDFDGLKVRSNPAIGVCFPGSTRPGVGSVP